MLWTDNRLMPLADDAPYIAPDGTTYLAAWPKSDIPGLVPVTETPRPSTAPTGYTVDGQARGGVTVEVIDGREWRIEEIDGTPSQVWHTMPRPEMTLDEAKAVKAQGMTTACAAAIMAGFVHAALGAPHTYPMSANDRANLQGRVSQAQLDPGGTYTLWCADGDGVWAKRLHTSAQIIQVGLAAAQWVQTCSDRLSGEDGLGGLLKDVADAQSVAEVNAVVW